MLIAFVCLAANSIWQCVRVFSYALFHCRYAGGLAHETQKLVMEFARRIPGKLKPFSTTRLAARLAGDHVLGQSTAVGWQFGNIRPGEAQILASIVNALDPQRVFEFGTFNGWTTSILAHNVPGRSLLLGHSWARVFTLDLPFDSDGHLRHDAHEEWFDAKTLNSRSCSRWYRKHEYDHAQVAELFGDSMAFDFRPYYAAIDFVLIDAAHSLAYVQHDTVAAFQMLTARGVIVWHDYEHSHPQIVRYLEGLAKGGNLYYIENTRFAIRLPPDVA